MRLQTSSCKQILVQYLLSAIKKKIKQAVSFKSFNCICQPVEEWIHLVMICHWSLIGTKESLLWFTPTVMQMKLLQVRADVSHVIHKI